MPIKTSDSRQLGSRVGLFLRQATDLVGPTLVILILLDLGLYVIVHRSHILGLEVDIQSPSVLFAKLLDLDGRDGRRIVVLGDSVVYGSRMQAAGDQDWRAHTIAAEIESMLRGTARGRPLTVLNLGMDGALPADLEQMTRLSLATHPDCIVSDVSLRSFSADFVNEKDRTSRPWLSNITIDEHFNLVTRRDNLPLTQRIEAGAKDLATNYWRLYRLRDFVQWLVFGGQPELMVKKLRSGLDAALRRLAFLRPPTQEEEPGLDDVILMLKAKARYGSITLDPSHPQLQALRRTLDTLASQGRCAVFFYATEDQTKISELIEPNRYRALLAQLAQVFAPYADRGIAYVPPLDMLKPDEYIDYGHLFSSGNAQVAKAVVEGGLAKLLSSTDDKWTLR